MYEEEAAVEPEQAQPESEGDEQVPSSTADSEPEDDAVSAVLVEASTPPPNSREKPPLGPDAQLLHCSGDQRVDSQEEPRIGFDIIIIHGLYGSHDYRLPSGPGSGDTEWVVDFTDLYECWCPYRILRFEYDPLKLFAGRRTREAIRQAAIRLLRAITATREHDDQSRLIIFAAHDVGGILLKEALILASLGNNGWSNIYEMARTLIFQGVPHRSLNNLDMEERLSRFFYASYDTDLATVRPSVSLVPDFAAAVIEINGCFVESQVPLRSHIMSLHDHNGLSNINSIFDGYFATMGVPLETRFAKMDAYPEWNDFVGSLRNTTDVVCVSVGAEQLRFERNILALSSPINPFQTAKGENVLESSPVYQSWLDHRGPQILYIHGSDKVREVAEQVFYDLEDVAGRETRKTTVLYFSFDKWDVRCDSLRDMLSTFLAQMICHSPSMADRIRWTFMRLHQERGWTETDLMNWFESYRHSESFQHVICVINHFDECTEASRALFLEAFAFLARASEFPWKIVVTSHQPGALLGELSSPWSANLDLGSLDLEPINTTDFEQDMTRLIKLRPDLSLLADQVRQELQTIQDFDPLVRQIIWEQARAHPDWPDKVTTQDIFGPLDNLPGQGREEHSLERLLQSVLEGIPEQPSLRRILTWLLYSVRPLSIWELASVLYLGSEQDQGDLCPSDSALEALVRKIHTWFAGILSVEQNEFKFRHPRLRNILMGDGLGGQGKREPRYLWEELRPSAHLEIAKLCLDFLSRPRVKEWIDSEFQAADSDNFESPIVADRSNLCSYSLQAWTHHYLLGLPSDELDWTLSRHVSDELAHSWARGYWSLSNPFTRSVASLKSLFPIFAGLGRIDLVRSQGEGDICQGLLEAASKGQAEAVSSIWDTLWEPSFSSESQVLSDALVAAGASGNEDLMLMLLARFQARADFDVSRIPPSLVHRSSSLGLDRFADRLLTLGCDPDVDLYSRPEDFSSPLARATSYAHLRTTQVFIKHNANVNYKEDDGRCTIHDIAWQGHPEIAEVFVKEGNFDVEATDDSNKTTLYFACLWGRRDVVEMLLKLGADPDMGYKPDGKQGDWLPLMVAVDDGFIQCVQLLLENRANPNLVGPEGTALWYAAIRGHIDVCRLLLENGADPNYSTSSSAILFQMLSSYTGDPQHRLKIFELLLDHGANPDIVDDHGDPLLMRALDFGDIAYLRMLLDYGADIEIKNSSEETILHRCAAEQQIDWVDLLLERNADVDVKNNDGATPLNMAFREPRILSKLLEKSSDVNTLRDGETCLMSAVYSNKTDSMRCLLEHSATMVDYVNVGRFESLSGHTALSLAAREGFGEAVTILAEAGANLQHACGYRTSPVVHFAAEANGDALPALLAFSPRVDVDQRNVHGSTALHSMDTSLANVKLLVNAGADVNAQNKVKGDTPLCVACEAGDLDRVTYLISKGAIPEISSRSFGSALTQACRLGHLKVVQYLIEHGADIDVSSPGIYGTPLQAACLQHRFDISDRAELVEYLIDQGADLSLKAGRLGFPINAASFLGRASLLSVLVAKGLSIDVRDDLDRSPVHFAALNGFDNFKIIVDAGADVSVRDITGRLPFHMAAQSGHVKALEMIGSIVPIQDMVNDTDRDGWTPLCWAARGVYWFTYTEFPCETPDEIKVIKYLLKNGADRTIKVKVGDEFWTPLKIARFHDQSAQMIKLLKYGLAPPPKTKDSEALPAESEEDESRIGYRWIELCDVCGVTCCGLKHICTVCDFECCFKCFPRIKEYHDHYDSFQEVGPEYMKEVEKREEEEEEGGEEEEDKPGLIDSDTSSDSDTDSDMDSDSS